MSTGTEERTLTALFLGDPAFVAAIVLHGVLGPRLSRTLSTRESTVLFETGAASFLIPFYA